MSELLFVFDCDQESLLVLSPLLNKLLFINLNVVVLSCV